MPIFTWNDTYSVSVKGMDEQHKKLFDIINQLFTAMSAGKGKEALEPVLKEMYDYTVTHFTAEEKLLQELGYPGLVEQKRQHAIYVQKVAEMQQKLGTSAKMALPMETSQFLKDWLLNHILVVDKKYSNFLTGKGVK